MGPERYRKLPGQENPDTEDVNPTSFDDTSAADYFWERFMFPKMVHPFGVTKRAYDGTKCMKVLKHEVISINSELNISSDVQPLQHMKRIFYRNGFHSSLDEAEEVEKQFMPVGAYSGITGDGKVGFSDANDKWSCQQFLRDRSKDLYLMIVPENYQQISEVSTDNCPSFDICIRNKYTVTVKT